MSKQIPETGELPTSTRVDPDMRYVTLPVSQLRTAFVLSVGVGSTVFWIDRFLVMDDLASYSLSAPYSHPEQGLVVAAVVGACAFAILAAPILAGVAIRWRLMRRLKHPGLAPVVALNRFQRSGQTAVLTAVVTTAAALPVLFSGVSDAARNDGRLDPTITLPESIAATQMKLPLRPRLIINVRRDGTVTVSGSRYRDRDSDVEPQSRPGAQSGKTASRSWDQLRRLAMTEAAGCTGPDGRTGLSVYIRGDVDATWRQVYSILTLCRETGIERVSFAVAPKGPR